MKSIIITADDFGMCKEVNEAIINCISLGTVSSTNVMVNMDFAFEGKKLLNYDVSIGLHWNITAGKSVLPKKDIPSLVDDNGQFYSLSLFKKKLLAKKIKLCDIKKELIAQYEKFIMIFGKKPDYWNSHQNSSLITPLINFFFRLGKELNIPFTRTFIRCYGDFDKISFRRKIRELIVRLGVKYYFGFLAKKYFLLPDARYFSFDSKTKLNIDKLIFSLNNNTYNVIELVCHPSINDQNVFFGNLSKIRLDEYHMFFYDGQKILEKFKNNNLKITKYSILFERKQNGKI